MIHILNGREELQQGTVLNLPHEQDTFDKVFAINRLHHWPDSADGQCEAWRVLRHDGLIAIAEQLHGIQSEMDSRKRGDNLVKQLADAAFHPVAFTSEPLMGGPAICIMGIKPIHSEQERFVHSGKSSFIY